MSEHQRYERQRDFTMDTMISLLDEMDHVLSGLKEDDAVWNHLLNQWSQMLLRNLEELGVYQLDVYGKTFNPEVAEAMKTVAKESLSVESMVPYQVVEVHCAKLNNWLSIMHTEATS